MFTSFTIPLVYYNSFLLRIVAKILLPSPLVLRGLIITEALDDLTMPNNNLSFFTNNVKEIKSLKRVFT